MTTYTFNPTNPQQYAYNWRNKSTWSPRVVPDSPDADVVFPVITSSNGPVSFEVVVSSKDQYSIQSLTMEANYLSLDGALAVSGAIDLAGGSEIDMAGGTLTAGSLTVAGVDIQGRGNVNVGSLVVDSEIVGNNLNVTAESLTNNGQLIAISGNLTVKVAAGGFANLVGGTLTGGTYRAGPIAISGPRTNTLFLNVGQLLTTDAADIEIDRGGAIKFFDSSTSQYVPIQASLQTIASDGSLTLSKQTYKWGSLVDSGALTLADNAIFKSPDLTIASSGALSGTGTVDGPVVNNGNIFATATNGDNGIVVQDLVVNGAITGAGAIEVAATLVPGPRSYYWAGGTVELNGATSQNVAFAEATGTLQLDRPTSFKGTISGDAPGADIVLENISYSSVTSYSYSGNAEGGTLHIQTTRGNYALKFAGKYYSQDFVLAAGPQPLSTSPPSLLVYLTVPPSPEIAGAVANQDITDKQTVDPFSTLTVTEPNSGVVDSVSVTLSNASDGYLSNLGGGSYDAATGVYTVSGTAAAVTSALDGLVFTPNVSPGSTVTTSFTIEVDDGVSAPATNSTTSVVTTSVSGGGQVVGFCGSPGNAASLYDTNGDADRLFGSNGTVFLTDAQAYIIGGGDTVNFLGPSGDAANLSSTGGVWDAVYASNSAITLNGAEAAIIGGDDAISLEASSSLSLASTSGNWDAVSGSSQTIILDSAQAGVVGGGDTLWLSGSSSVSLASTNGNWDAVNGVSQTVILDSAQAGVIGGGNTLWLAGSSSVSLASTNGNWDAVNGSNQTEILNGAQATLIGDGNEIYLGAANAFTLSGSSEHLVTSQTIGQDWITGFGSSDTMQFSSSDFANFAALQNAMTQSGANTVITLNSTNSITLYNVQASSLQASQFSFV